MKNKIITIICFLFFAENLVLIGSYFGACLAIQHEKNYKSVAEIQKESTPVEKIYTIVHKNN